MCFVDFSEDKAQLSKLVEAVKTNFNDRADEVRKWFCACVMQEQNEHNKLRFCRCVLALHKLTLVEYF